MNTTEYEKLTQQGTALSLQNENADLIKNKLIVIDTIAGVVKNNLVAEVDYMTIPGTNKPTLLKSGAQKIALTYGLIANYDILERVSTKEMVKYMFKCSLTNGNGLKVAEGYGLCSSLEPKYYKNKNNPFEIENTILKMAEKRAFVDAIVSIGNLSKVFTQDMEDLQKDNEVMEIRAKEQKISKEIVFELYNFFYSTFIPNYEKIPYKERKAQQELVKPYIKEILSSLGNYASIYELTNDLVDPFKNAVVKHLQNISAINKQVQEKSFEITGDMWETNDQIVYPNNANNNDEFLDLEKLEW